MQSVGDEVYSRLTILLLPLSLLPYAHLLLGTVQWPGEVWELENRRTVSALQCKTVQVCGIQRACRLVRNNVLFPYVNSCVQFFYFDTFFSMQLWAESLSHRICFHHHPSLPTCDGTKHKHIQGILLIRCISEGSSKHLSYYQIARNYTRLHFNTKQFFLSSNLKAYIYFFQFTKCHNAHITHQAGGTVRLFHREYECYIAAEGSFAEDPAVVEDGRRNMLKRSKVECSGL